MAAAPRKWDITPPCLPAGWLFPFSGGAPWSPDHASPPSPPHINSSPAVPRAAAKPRDLRNRPVASARCRLCRHCPALGGSSAGHPLWAHPRRDGWAARWGGAGRVTPHFVLLTEGELEVHLGPGPPPQAGVSSQPHRTWAQQADPLCLHPVGCPPPASVRQSVTSPFHVLPPSPVGLTWTTARPLSHAAPDTLWAPLSSQRRLGLGWLPFLHGDRTPMTRCSATDSRGVQTPGFVVDVEGGGEEGSPRLHHREILKCCGKRYRYNYVFQSA